MYFYIAWLPWPNATSVRLITTNPLDNGVFPFQKQAAIRCTPTNLTNVPTISKVAYLIMQLIWLQIPELLGCCMCILICTSCINYVIGVASLVCYPFKDARRGSFCIFIKSLLLQLQVEIFIWTFFAKNQEKMVLFARKVCDRSVNVIFRLRLVTS